MGPLLCSQFSGSAGVEGRCQILGGLVCKSFHLLAFSYFFPFRSGPLAEAVKPYLWFPLTSAAVERSFSLAGLVDAKNRQKMGKGLRQAAVTMFCNGDVEQRFTTH